MERPNPLRFPLRPHKGGAGERGCAGGGGSAPMAVLPPPPCHRRQLAPQSDVPSLDVVDEVEYVPETVDGGGCEHRSERSSSAARAWARDMRTEPELRVIISDGASSGQLDCRDGASISLRAWTPCHSPQSYWGA